jgi:hypothetical protein
MRAEFAELVRGWTLISGLDAITERIEQAAEWSKINGPLYPDEAKTVELMIQCQIARGMGAYDRDEDDYGDSGGERYCYTCDGKGYIVACIDDLCHGQEECIHGDPPVTCPDCKGRSADL